MSPLAPRASDVSTIRADVMGTSAEIIVVGGPRTRGGSEGAARRARTLLDDLERRWTRFRPDSDIVRLNQSAGAAVRVHWTTRDLLLLSIECWRRTEGRFDPTVGAALVAAGYDRSFRTIDVTAPAPVVSLAPAPGCADIRIDREACTVQMPAGLTLDLGGIGKGYAADVLVAELTDAGAAGACVNVGGDVRVRGSAPTGTWAIALEDPLDPQRHLGTVHLHDGALAVSAAMARQWRTTNGLAHHVFDPRLGRPVDTGIAGAAVLAGAGWWAEALTKVLMTSTPPQALDLLDRVGAGAHGLIVDTEGTIDHHESLLPFLRGTLTPRREPTTC